jgi:hypothetical protein
VSGSGNGLQAESCFRWSNFLRARLGAAGKPVLLVNLDETSIPLWVKPKKGYVIFGRPGCRAVLRRGPGPSLSLRRSSASLVAFLCDDPAIQTILPQVFVSNERLLTEADVRQLNGTCSRNVFFIRRKSSWVNAKLLVEIVHLLAQCLRGVLATHRVVLHMDAFRAHLHTSVLRACARAGLFLMFIPASMTGWLQPLDVCVFSSYKRWVGSEVEKKRLASPAGSISRAEVMDAYSRGIGAVMEAQSWQHAFEATGLRGQDRLSSELVLRLQWAVPHVVPSTFPSLGDLQAVYPAGSHIPVEELFELLVRCERPAQLVLPRRARLPPAVAPSSP